MTLSTISLLVHNYPPLMNESTVPTLSPIQSTVPTLSPIQSTVPTLSPIRSTVTTLSPIQEIDILREINDAEAKNLVPAIVYTVVLMIAGVLGNPIAFYIYYKRWLKTTTRVFLLFLSVLDLVNCVFTMPFEIWWMANFYYFPYVNSCMISRFVTYSNNNTSTAIILFIAIERYMHICRPNGWNFSVPFAKWACVASLCVAGAMSWPAILLYGKKTVNIPASFMGVMTNVTGVMCNVKDRSENTKMAKYFLLSMWLVFVVGVVILLVLYMLIGWAILQKGSNKRKRSTLHSARNRRKSHVSKATIVSHGANRPTTSFIASTREQPLEKLSHPTVNLDDENSTLNNDTIGDISISEERIMSKAQKRSNGKPSPVNESSNDNIKRITDGSGSDIMQNSSLHLVMSADGSPSNSKNDVFGPLAVSNSLPSGIAKSVPARSLKAHTTHSSQMKDPHSTLMLFVISVIFVLSFLPIFVIVTVRVRAGPNFYQTLSPYKAVLVHIFSRVFMMNNSTKPIMYWLFNYQFRVEVKRLFRACCTCRNSHHPKHVKG